MEKPRGPFFSKKEKIIIASIFAFLFLASIIVTINIVSQGYYGEFGYGNILTAAIMLLVVSTAIFSYKNRHKAVSVYFTLFFRPYFAYFIKEKNFTADAKFIRQHCIKIIIFLAQIPFHIPLLVLEWVWGWSLLLYIIPAGIFAIMNNTPSARKERKMQSETDNRESIEESQQRFRDNMY